jgi:hypothetical protein
MRPVLVCIAAVVALLTMGCGGGEANPIPPIDRNLAPARQFSAFPLYYRGASYRGLSMTSAGSRDVSAYRRNASIQFTYGQCTPPPNDEHQTCHPPVEINNYASCANALRGWAPRRMVLLRGARARVYYDYGIFESVRITTGRTTVVIHAKNERSALDIARGLRSVDGRVSARASFPSPVRLTPRLRTRLCGGWG